MIMLILNLLYFGCFFYINFDYDYDYYDCCCWIL